MNTAQLLLGQLTRTKSLSLPAYARPEKKTPMASNIRDSGMLTLTRFGFLPVDWFNAHPDNTKGKTKDNVWFEDNKVEKAYVFASLGERFEIPEPSLGWYLTTIGSSIAILLSCCFLMKSNFFPQQPNWLTLTDNCRSRVPALLGACLSLSALEWILIVPALHIRDSLHIRNTAVVTTNIVATIAFLVPLGVWVAVLLRTLPAGILRGKTRIREAMYPFGFVAFYAFILLMWAWSCGGLGWARTPPALMFRLRSLQLYSGASPALPLVLLSSMFAGGFVGYFYRFTQAGMSRPVISPLAPEGARSYYNAVEHFIDAPRRLASKDLAWRLGTCCLAVGLSMLVLWKRLRPFEHSEDGFTAPFNWAFSGAVTALAVGLASGCYDLWFTWRNLKRVLRTIEFIPLDDAFARVARCWPRRPIWAFWRSISQE